MVKRLNSKQRLRKIENDADDQLKNVRFLKKLDFSDKKDKIAFEYLKHWKRKDNWKFNKKLQFYLFNLCLYRTNQVITEKLH